MEDGNYNIRKSESDRFRQVSLFKGEQTYVFRYLPGDEVDIIGALADLTKREDIDFDWFDAAVISFKIGRKIEKDLENK